MQFELPCIPAYCFKHITAQYISHNYSKAKSYCVKLDLLAEAWQQALDERASDATETPGADCYNEWLEYLSLVADIYGKSAVTRTIMSTNVLDKLAKQSILRGIDTHAHTKSVRDFGRYILIALYGYHARVINNMLESVAQDAADNEIDYEQLYDELFLIIKTCKPSGFDDVLWEQYVWSYA